MRVFVTGATGFVGAAVVRELLGAGHQVLGLARRDGGAAALAETGADVQRGDLSDPGGLAAAAKTCDAVVHTAFIHDFSNMAHAGETDRNAVEAMGAALAGSGRPLIVTSGTAIAGAGKAASEDDAADAQTPGAHRAATEILTLELASRGVRSSLVRLPPSVHGDGDHGFVPTLVGIAREKGVSAYIADGSNRWAAVHRLDAAHLFRLVVENGKAGARYHAVGDAGIPTKEIATIIGRRLNIPVVSKPAEEAGDHFGWLARFFALDLPAKSALTEERLGWRATHRGLVADLDSEAYFRR